MSSAIFLLLLKIGACETLLTGLEEIQSIVNCVQEVDPWLPSSYHCPGHGAQGAGLSWPGRGNVGDLILRPPRARAPAGR